MRHLGDLSQLSRRCAAPAAVPLAARLTVALAALAVGPAPAQQEPVTLKLERALGAHRARGTPRLPTYARADHMQGEVDERVQMDGSVELRRSGVTVRGDSAEYLCASDEAKVHGNARLYDRGTVFYGPELDYRLEAHTGQMPQASYTYSPRQGRGESTLIEFLGEDRYRMHDATYSNCAPGDESWWVKSETLDIDRQEQRAVGHHSTMYFQGVPILSSPYFSMPLGDQRRSGILTPSYYFDSRSGFEATVPYYWNMAPNYDYTITPALYPRLGALLGNEFRFLEPTVRGVVDYDNMPYDRATGSSRNHTMVLASYAGSSGLSGYINYNRVSDDRFLTDFSHSLSEAAPIELPQVESITYGQAYWNATVQVARNQTLFSLLNPPGTPAGGQQPPPYDRVPEVTLNGFRADWHGFDLAATFDATRFRNETLEEASRFILNPSLAYPVLGAAYFVVPKIQYHVTEYDLDPNYRDGSSVTRALPIASLDSGLIFERDTRWLGHSATQTLEPRIFYAYIPLNRSQNALPNFDSADPTFTFAQLFTENAYTGSDRIGEANQITTAVTSRMIDSETGAERFRTAIGQRFYFGPQRVTLPHEAPRANLTSDLLLEASAQTAREWKAETELEYSAVESQIVRADVALRWQPKAASVVDLSYRYQSATLHQIDLAMQWPLSRKWYGVTNLNYSLLGHGGAPGDLSFTTHGRAWVETVVGLEYKADCWVGRLVGQRYSTDGGITRTTTVFLQIELNGFTSLGTRSPLEQLRRSIPGYQRINPLPAAPGPFDNYQ